MWLIYIFSLLPIWVHAVTWEKSLPEGFSVKITIPQTEINLDESLKIELEASFPKDYVLDTKTLNKNLINDLGFGPLPFYLVDTALNSADTSQKIIYTLEPNLTGTFWLSFLNIPFNSKLDKEKKTEISSEVFNIVISEGPKASLGSNLTAPVFLLPFEYPLSLSEENKNYFQQRQIAWEKRNLALYQARQFPWKESLFLAGLIGIFLMTLTKKREEPSKALTAKDTALKALEKLKLSSDDREARYLSLVQIIRVYIEERYGLNAPTLTTEEFLSNSLESSFFDQTTHKQLKEFLLHTDQVKFAKHNPTQEEWDDAFEAAKKFINNEKAYE